MIEVTLSPVDITADDENELLLALTNRASEPYTNIVFNLQLPSEVLLLRGLDKVGLSNLDPGESHKAKIVVVPKLAGAWAATGSSISFLDRRGCRTSVKDLNLVLKATIREPPPAPELALRVSLKPLLQKHWQKLNGQIENTGGVELWRILVRVSGGVESDGPCSVGDLHPGQNQSFAINVYPLQTGASVPLKFEVEFLDSSGKPQRVPQSFDVEVHESQKITTDRPPDPSPKYNFKNIRALLREVFSDTELRQMCLDIDALQPVYDSLARNTGKDEIVDRIVERAMHKDGFDLILDLARQESPRAWERHQPYFAQWANRRTILFLAADPQDISRLKLQKEMREIKDTLERAPLRDRFALHSEMAVCSEGLTRELLRIRPSIMHFSGHGSRSGAICIENKYGKTHPVKAETLSFLLQLDLLAKSLECVVLNACYSEIQARVIAQHAKYVVGMGDQISDDSAIDFSIGFYQALGAGSNIVDAFKTGLALIRLNESNTAPGHTIPRLYIDGLLSIQD
jgi:hypothetical protein